MQAEAILFDLFNTLVLLENDEAYYMPSLKRLHQFLVKNGVGIAFEDFVRVYFEVRDRLYEETRENLEEPHFNVRVSQTLQELGCRLDVSHPIVVGATEAFCEEFMKYVRPDDDALYVLKRLHGKFKLGIVSNLAIPECASRILEKFAFSGLFGAVVISGAINKRKPSPEIYKAALKALGVTADRAVFVGDTPGVDIKGAKEVGLRAVLIERQPSQKGPQHFTYQVPGAYEKVAADGVVKSLRELLNIVEDP